MVRLSRNPSALDAAFLSSFMPLTCACHARITRTVEEFISIFMVRRILSRSAYASRHDVHPKRARRRSGSALTRSKHSFSRRIVSTKPSQPVNAPSFTRFRMRDATREHTSRCLRVSSAKSRHRVKAPAAAIMAMRDATLTHKPSSRACSEARSCHARRHRVAEPCISLAAMPRSLSRSSDALDAVSAHVLNAETSRRLRKRAAMRARSAFRRRRLVGAPPHERAGQRAVADARAHALHDVAATRALVERRAPLHVEQHLQAVRGLRLDVAAEPVEGGALRRPSADHARAARARRWASATSSTSARASLVSAMAVRHLAKQYDRFFPDHAASARRVRSPPRRARRAAGTCAPSSDGSGCAGSRRTRTAARAAARVAPRAPARERALRRVALPERDGDHPVLHRGFARRVRSARATTRVGSRLETPPP